MPSRPRSASVSPLNPTMKLVAAPSGLGWAIPVGLLFTVVGLLVFWMTTLRPLWQAVASTRWPAVEGVVVSSELKEKVHRDGSTYRVEIRYRFGWDGREWEGDRYDFFDGYSNVGVNEMREAVRAHPAGRRVTVHVNPDAPESSVLSRGVGPVPWAGWYFLLFPGLGITAVVWAWRIHRRQRDDPDGAAAEAAAARARVAAMPDPMRAGEVELTAVPSGLASLAPVGLFFLLWNALLATMLVTTLADGVEGGGEWFMLLFLVPFVLVGLGMTALTVQAIFQSFAPRMVPRLDPSRLRLGARVPFTWRLRGAPVRSLRVQLVAREEASYEEGSSTRTDRTVVHRATVFDSDDPRALAEGAAELVLPSAENAAPALTAKNNRLSWELRVEGASPWGADLEDRFALPVRGPAEVAPVKAHAESREDAGYGLTLRMGGRYAPGEILVATVAREAGAAPGPLTARLGWFTEGRGTRDAGVAWSDEWPELAPGAERTFEVRLPEAPWSFAGKLVAVEWRLEVLDAGGAPLVAAPLVIAPRGERVRLPELPEEKRPWSWKKPFGKIEVEPA